MSKIWTRNFWKDTAERAIWTAAQAALLVIGAEMIDGEQVINVAAVDWLNVLGFAVGGAVLAVLKALGAVTRTGTASTVRDTPHDNGPGTHVELGA